MSKQNLQQKRVDVAHNVYKIVTRAATFGNTSNILNLKRDWGFKRLFQEMYFQTI